MVDRVGVGTGSMPAGAAKTTKQRWRSEAQGATGKRQKGTTLPVDQLKFIGVKFRKVPRKPGA